MCALNCGVCFLRTQLADINFISECRAKLHLSQLNRVGPLSIPCFLVLMLFLQITADLELLCDWLSISSDAVGPLLIRELRLLPTLFIMQERQIYMCSKVKFLYK